MKHQNTNTLYDIKLFENHLSEWTREEGTGAGAY